MISPSLKERVTIRIFAESFQNEQNTEESQSKLKVIGLQAQKLTHYQGNVSSKTTL